MEIKDMLTTGAMLIIGIIALKAFGGIQGLSTMFGGLAEGIGTLAGGAPGTGAPGLSGAVFTGVDVPIEEPTDEPLTVAHIPSLIELFGLGTIEPTPIDPADIIPDPTAQPPSFWELINPFVRPPAPYTYTPPATYAPSLLPFQPPSEPDPIIPSDPAHPATDPFIGGR